jgi:hypothetical protein
MRPTTLRFALFALLAMTALGGCGNPLSLAPPRFENQVDTVRIWAATQTPVHLASGYAITFRQVVRLDQVSAFDFLYDVDRAGRRIFLPFEAVAHTGRLTGNPGLQATPTPFEAITEAQQLGYLTTDTIPLAVDQVFYARSVVDPNCGLGIPYYAKLKVLGFDDSDRSVQFEILNNINCGYRSLAIGLPEK